MADIKLNIDKYLNHQNRCLFDELSAVYNIKLFQSDEIKDWCIENNKPIIRTPIDDLSIASFTHELLHLYLDYLEITPKEKVYHQIWHIQLILKINKHFLFDHIYNVSSHKKMYPYFREMGFKDIDFVKDNGSFFSNYDYLLITIFKKLRIFKTTWISRFIGHFFALKNDVVEIRRERNRRMLFKLAQLDKSLYNILYDFDTTWEKQKSLDCSQNFQKLSDDLYNWIKINRMIKITSLIW